MTSADLSDRLAELEKNQMATKPVEPILIERANNLGWFASTPEDYPLRFAVAGATEDEARAKFLKSLAHWESIGPETRLEERA